MSTTPRPDNLPLAFGCDHPAGTRVILRPGTFIIGSLVAHAIFSLSLTASMPFQADDTLSILFSAAWLFFIGAIPAVMVAIIFGVPTAFALRRVHSQCVHVLAFFAVGILPGLLLTGGESVAGMLSGLAAGVGRLSVWKLAKIEVPPGTAGAA